MALRRLGVGADIDEHRSNPSGAANWYVCSRNEPAPSTPRNGHTCHAAIVV
jgi:hypothetical protein